MGALHIFMIFILFPTKSYSEQKIYYIVAEEITWDYAPTGKNLVTNDQSFADHNLEYDPENQRYGHIYSKIVYREYTDSTFSHVKKSPDYLGFLGPVLKADVDDELVVVFNNSASHELSIHPHGIVYDKNNEGSGYGGRSGVTPGSVYRYTWNITEESGPDTDRGCVSYLYHSDVDFVRDVNTGLVGFILVCLKNEEFTPHEDVFLFVGIIDENLSWMSEAGDSAVETNRMHAINGYVYGNMPNLTVCLGEKTRFHVASLSTSDDVHAVRMFGHSFSYNGKRYDALPVYSGASLTAETTPSETGKWLFSSTLRHHIEEGMQTLITVAQCGNSKPVIEISGKVRKYYISAEQVIWNGLNRTVFVGYTNRDFDTKLPRIAFETYLGALGPLLKAEIGDVIKIVLYNKLNTTLSIQPVGLRTGKAYEGHIYNDSITDKIQTAPGEKRTYFWFVPQYTGPEMGEHLCIPRYYTTNFGQEQELIGPILICQQFSLNENDNQVNGVIDLFLYILENDKNGKDTNGFDKDNFPELQLCTSVTYHLHLSTFGSHLETILTTGDPFDVYGSKSSSFGLIPYLPISVKLQHTQEGIFHVKSFPDGVIGLSLNVSRCGSLLVSEDFTESGDVTFLGIIKSRWYYDRRKLGTTKWKRGQSGDFKMTPRYQKVIYGQYFQNFVRPDSTRRLPYQGYLGHFFYASVGEILQIALKNSADRNFSMYTPGVISNFDGKLLPSKIVNITWRIPQSVGPGSGDAECIAKTYYSNLNTEKDISTGLVGPLIICSKGIKADSDFKHTILFFGEVDETQSWYFRKNVEKQYGRNSDLHLDDPDLVNNNRIQVINGVSDGKLSEIQLEPAKSQFIHFFNIGFRFQSIHLPGVIFPKTSNHFVGRDTIGLHPGTSYSLKITPKSVGKWRLVGYGINKHWNKMAAFIHVPSSTGGAS